MPFCKQAMLLAVVLASTGAQATPLSVPFDFSKSEIGLDVTVKGRPLYMILDTGVDPSVIDSGRADTLGLKLDKKAGGEVSGQGDAKHASAVPTTIDNLTIGGRAFPSIDALASDLSGLSVRYGHAFDGVLGFSFLNHRIVLIDYPARKLGILDNPSDAAPATRTCRVHWTTPLKSFADDNIPIIPGFRFGTASGPISLDTGSSGGITLYRETLALPGVKAALVEKGLVSGAGARGGYTSKEYTFNEPVGFGPFALPAGGTVVVHDVKGFSDPRVANVGNKLFAAMKLKMLLDYRGRQMTFFGDCN